MHTAKQDFEDEVFSNWLNRVDATVGYETRCQLGSTVRWRKVWFLGHETAAGITLMQALKAARVTIK